MNLCAQNGKNSPRRSFAARIVSAGLCRDINAAASPLPSLFFRCCQLLLVYHVNRSLGIPDEIFTFGDDVILTVLGQVWCDVWQKRTT